MVNSIQATLALVLVSLSVAFGQICSLDEKFNLTRSECITFMNVNKFDVGDFKFDKFCSFPSCKSSTLLLQKYSKDCDENINPNDVEKLFVVPNYCERSCQDQLSEFATSKKNCLSAGQDRPGYCAFCRKHQKIAPDLKTACRTFESAENISYQSNILEAIERCSLIENPVPKASESSAGGNTTYIIIGVVAGVIVIAALLWLLLRPKQRLDDAYYSRTISGQFTNNSRYTANGRGNTTKGMTNSGGHTAERNRNVKMANDIRFDQELAQFRIAQQDIQNVSLLVKGGYGVVFHATFGKIEVAMKQLLPSKAKDADSIQDFMNEIRLCARLEHPKIVKFIGISWSTLQDLAVLSEFMANGDVTSLIRKERRKNEESRSLHWIGQHLYVQHDHAGANSNNPSYNHTSSNTTNSSANSSRINCSKTSIAADVADALVYLHSFKPSVIHRDLKSKNVLLSGTWEAKLSDFGISRVTSLEETMTANIGTVAWIAPEVLTGGNYSEKADIYSFGVLMCELDTLSVPYADITGKSKDNGFSNARIAMMVSDGSLQPTFTDTMPPALLALSQECLSFHEQDRPSAMQVSYRLRTILKEMDEQAL